MNIFTGYIKQTIKNISSGTSPYQFTYANLKSFSDLLSSLSKLDKQMIEIDNDYDNYEDCYKTIEIPKKNKPQKIFMEIFLKIFQKMEN